MAKILDVFQATDGLDVTCEANGKTVRWHFADPPADVQSAVDKLEQDTAPPEVVVIGEDGQVINA